MTNMILLTIDALRADHVSCYGYDRKTTPNLDAFAARNRRYRTCIAQSSHTRESMPSMFFSAYPFELGDVGPVPTDRPTIASVLSESGFETGGFHSNPYLSRAYGFDRGFETFDDSLPLGRNRIATFLYRVLNYVRTRPYTRAEELTDRGLDWLETTEGERRFLWLHYMDPHGPYQPPDRYQRRYREETLTPRFAKRLWRRTVDNPDSITLKERQTLVDLYDGEIRYLDAELGRFLDELDERELLTDSLVIVGADHGDAFGEHGTFGHPRRLFEELVRVPLIVSPPSDDSGYELATSVQNVDLGPTILRSQDVEIPDEFRGAPLAIEGNQLYEEPPDHSGVTFAQASGEGEDSHIQRYMIRTDEFKLHVEVDTNTDDRTTELYEIADESTDVSKSYPDETTRLRDILDEHIRTFDSRPESREDEVDDIVSDRLENLGYR